MGLMNIGLIALFLTGISGQNNTTNTNLTTMSTGTILIQQAMTSTMSTSTSTSTSMTTTTTADFHDPCVESAKKNLLDNLNQNYPNFQTLTNNLTSPLNFYRNLFNASFKLDSLQAYCKTYRDNRAEIDKCSNSSMKSYTLILLAPADYVCIKKTNDYVQNIECLEKLNNNVKSTQCRTSQCSQYEQASLNARNPPAGTTRQQLQDWAIGDCSYTKCVADCREQVMKDENCGNGNTELELEVLKSALSAAQSVSDVTDTLKLAVTNAVQVVFPQQCRDVASMTLKNFAGAANDYLAAAMNGTSNLFQSVFGATTKKPNGANDHLPYSILILLGMSVIFY